MVEVERGEQLELSCGRRHSVGRRRKSDRLQRLSESPADTYRACRADVLDCLVRGTFHGDGYVLVNLLALLERVREAEHERCAVALERGIGPVALVFGLPEIALQIEPHTTAGCEVDLEPVEGGEERQIDAVLEPLLLDQKGELTMDRSTRSSSAIPTSNGLLRRVQETEANPVVEQVPSRCAVEREADLPGGIAGHRPVPDEVVVVSDVSHREADIERVAAVVDLDFR